MAIAHISVRTISRGQGRSVIAAAAYRAGERLYCVRTGLVADYRRRDGVIATCVMIPGGGSCDRAELWNGAEAAERRCNATLAREYELALPHELDAEQRLALVREFAEVLIERYSVAVDFAIHAPSLEGDQRNFHCHMLTTTRVVDREKRFRAKTRVLDARETGPTEVLVLREVWTGLCNAALGRIGAMDRVDHRSHMDRGLLELPSEKLGLAAVAFERRTGLASERRLFLDARRDIFQAELEEERKKHPPLFDSTVIDHRDFRETGITVSPPRPQGAFDVSLRRSPPQITVAPMGQGGTPTDAAISRKAIDPSRIVRPFHNAMRDPPLLREGEEDVVYERVLHSTISENLAVEHRATMAPSASRVPAVAVSPDVVAAGNGLDDRALCGLLAGLRSAAVAEVRALILARAGEAANPSPFIIVDPNKVDCARPTAHAHLKPVFLGRHHESTGSVVESSRSAASNKRISFRQALSRYKSGRNDGTLLIGYDAATDRTYAGSINDRRDVGSNNVASIVKARELRSRRRKAETVPISLLSSGDDEGGWDRDLGPSVPKQKPATDDGNTVRRRIPPPSSPPPQSDPATTLQRSEQSVDLYAAVLALWSFALGDAPDTARHVLFFRTLRLIAAVIGVGDRELLAAVTAIRDWITAGRRPDLVEGARRAGARAVDAMEKAVAASSGPSDLTTMLRAADVEILRFLGETCRVDAPVTVATRPARPSPSVASSPSGPETIREKPIQVPHAADGKDDSLAPAKPDLSRSDQSPAAPARRGRAALTRRPASPTTKPPGRRSPGLGD